MRAELLALGLAIPLAGCETLGYYKQAVDGHVALMARAQPVAELRAAPETSPARRERLALATSIRAFASRELALPDNGTFRSFAEVDGRYVVWNVVAAPEFSIEAVQSCFPVAGCVSYRGFFDRKDAEAHAAARRAQGLDVHLYGVPAYSTLGWFDDPLLSTFIDYPDAQLARLIFHELAHQVVYLRDDPTFNESFAVAVEEAGVRRWLAATGRDAMLGRFLAQQARKREFIALIDEARARLAALYARDLDASAKRAAKHAELAALAERYAALKLRWNGFLGFDRFMQAPNNALLASIATYTARLPEFRRLFEASGGDFAAFYARVRETAASR
ncbi:MAG: aminopeptidase [Burkholderiales bacterium]|nr:aminopeptidase [Burkholderiales bacterium]